MFNNLRSTINSQRTLLIGSLIAALVVTAVVLIPAVGASIAAGVFLTPGLGMLFYTAPPIPLAIVALLLGGIVAVTFYLLRIKHSALVSGVGLSISYVLLTALNKLLQFEFYQKAILFILITFTLVYGLILISKRLRISTVVSVILCTILIGSSAYGAQLIEQAISKSKAPAALKAHRDAQNKIFETARRDVQFKVYYPTYTSTQLPATEPLLNGYSQASYSHINPHITFTLGGARVTQAALVKNQDKLMDFTRNCDINQVASVMISDSEVSQGVIDNSLSDLSRCKVAHQTPAGVNVYVLERGDFAIFYLQIDGTNIIIKFDGSRTEKYSETLLPEINKIIDSLQPISNDKLQRGDEGRASTY